MHAYLKEPYDHSTFVIIYDEGFGQQCIASYCKSTNTPGHWIQLKIAAWLHLGPQKTQDVAAQGSMTMKNSEKSRFSSMKCNKDGRVMNSEKQTFVQMSKEITVRECSSLFSLGLADIQAFRDMCNRFPTGPIEPLMTISPSQINLSSCSYVQSQFGRLFRGNINDWLWHIRIRRHSQNI